MYRNFIKDLIKPKKLEFEESSSSYGKFVVEPLERGFGTTIGNSFRRVLLSSLPGAAIVSIQIEGVKHEFSTIPGCIEDVTEIILNLKEVVLDLGDKESATLRLEAKGPVEVKAGMITGDNVRVINPDFHIASLNEEGAIKMEISARVGRGYVAAEANKQEGDPIGSIPVDSVFSPVRKVNHIVTRTRVGEDTDYDRLTLEIKTDGSITPEESIKGAAYILRDQFQVFVGVEETPVREIEKPSLPSDKPRLNEHLFRRIDELELSVRSSNCLENANIKYIGELVQRSEAEMLRTKNFGRKSLHEIKELLTEMGLNLGMRIDNFPLRDELDRMSEEAGANLLT